MSKKWPLVSTGLVVVLATLAAAHAAAQVKPENAEKPLGNKPQRIEWFSKLGLGMFIHWGVDSQLGMEIGHSLVGADEDYLRRFFEELPKTFHPREYCPGDWADLAKVAGFKYVVFTTKHHSGFCMFETATTKFNIMNTPYGKDITAELVDAFRKRGIAIGLYFSVDDFWLLHQQGRAIGRVQPGVTPAENEPLEKHDQAQLRELLTNYGPIDVVWFDGAATESMKGLCWELQPNVVVPGATGLKAIEQDIPDSRLRVPFETCMTIGGQWQYKSTHESYKSGTALIEKLVEIRAKGGNLLLNIGPKPNGQWPIEQEERVRELGLWNFVNHEAIYDVEPWPVVNEDNIWFTKRRGENTVYAIVTKPDWKWGTRKEITLRSVKAGPDTTVSVLGQSGKVLEYRPQVDPSAKWTQKENGLEISAMRAHRFYTPPDWPNAVVLKITDARPITALPSD